MLEIEDLLLHLKGPQTLYFAAGSAPLAACVAQAIGCQEMFAGLDVQRHSSINAKIGHAIDQQQIYADSHWQQIDVGSHWQQQASSAVQPIESSAGKQPTLLLSLQLQLTTAALSAAAVTQINFFDYAQAHASVALAWGHYLGHAWQQGVAIKPTPFLAARGHHIQLPCYPFTATSCWFAPQAPVAAAMTPDNPLQIADVLA